MKSIGSLKVLDDERENRKLLLKLPSWLTTRWARIVAEYRSTEGVFPSFSQFVQFMTKEADIANDPITSIPSFKTSELSSVSKVVRVKKGISLKTEGSGIKTDSEKGTDSKKPVSCYYCKKDHILNHCEEFVCRPLSERMAFVKDNRLCFRCLRKGHQSKRCQYKWKCETCSGTHASLLHNPDRAKPNISVKNSSLKVDAVPFQPQNADGVVQIEASNLCSDACSGAVSMQASSSVALSAMILPVYLSHSNNPSYERLVYALLDSQSDTSFILDSTCEALGVKGTDVKLSLSTMFAENKVVECKRVKGFMVRGFDSTLKISLPSMYTRCIMPANRSHIPSGEMIHKWPHLKEIKDKLMPITSCEIGLLIGYNCSRALIPREVIAPPQGDGPYAQRSDLGWGIVGVVDQVQEVDLIGFSHRILTYSVLGSDKPVCFSMKASTKELVSPRDVLKVLEGDLVCAEQGAGLSKEDQQFLVIMNSKVKQLEDGHYEMPLPFKPGQPNGLANNITVAQKRLNYLKSRLQRDPVYKADYVRFMNEMIQDGYAEKVPDNELHVSDVWYIPHHGVYTSQKSKIRVVFDCSSRFRGKSLNDCLLQGPDLANNLIGVLLRFREENIAFSCDIAKMFYQFRICPNQRNFVRFLWWDKGDTASQPSHYRMTVHIFGASSSPGCSNFGLKRVAEDYEHEFGSDVGQFIRTNFYVDDGLKSVSNVSVAVDLIRRTVQLCKKGGLKLHKFLSNSRHVLESVSKEARATDVQDVDLRFDSLPIEKALGIEWCVESDRFQFRVVIRDRPFTRRGLLATVASIYDPLGFVAPFTLVGKRILQHLCVIGADWDDSIPADSRKEWETWLKDIADLQKLSIKRCVKPTFDYERIEMHHFCDASCTGYGVASYLRFLSKSGDVHVTLVFGKARVAPIKPLTIPRLELTAAVMAIKVSLILKKEFTYSDVQHYFWSDSKVVLGYIANESKRFHLFVANRVGFIHSNSDVEQWNYVPGSKNVADIASRGCSASFLKSSRWFEGPEFLWYSVLPTFKVEPVLSNSDPEVRQANVLSSKSEPAFDLGRFEHISKLSRLKKAVALCLKFSRKLCNKSGSFDCSVKVADLREAELRIVSIVQKEAFKEEIEAIESGGSLVRSSSVAKLDPFVDPMGILRVGGRIRKSRMDEDFKYPILLPKCGHFTFLIISSSHSSVKHQGRGMTMNDIRSSGYWIIGGSSAVSKFIHYCIVCRRLRLVSQPPKMSDLPADRLKETPPFTNVAVDYFGPFFIKEGRKELKRWGIIFTCLFSRAVHLEVASSLTTSSFINALRRFIAIRGPIALLRSDQGTNFVGAKNELQCALQSMENSKIRDFLLRNNCDFEIVMNPPYSSHMGGVWERLIRSVRSILNVILSQQGSQLDGESLHTFMYEVGAVINSRPLTLEYIQDSDFPKTLTPNHLLTMKTKVVVSPPGDFCREDVYSVKRWRRIQYLVNVFWSRWKGEYLHILQSRQKWLRKHRNLCLGDIVIIKDDNSPRNMWLLGRIVEVYPSDDGVVRSVKLLVGDRNLDSHGKRVFGVTHLVRPACKLILLVEA